ncbi:MAG: efflux RND transporter periplasmic adaptor subunit [Nannocystis sp.]|nr:efflux RND transporter periplasmic adaptor subunit [Nannocystis sp.]MBA3549176.1 efflux RND transporter periplasmic adaptor subunit [Nannocystis sp.]
MLATLAMTASACGGEAGANAPGKGDKSGKGGNRSEMGGGPGAPEPLAIAVVEIEPAALERHYRTSGTLRALRSAEIVALQPGVVLELRAEEGDRVRAGQTLVRLDGRGFKLQAARDGLTAENAARELQRLEQLSEHLSREELDKQRFAMQSALASAQVSRHQASQTTVVAPFSGTITRRAIDVGNLATASTPLFSLADLSVLDVDLHVPEREATTVQAGAPATLELQDGSRFAARVERRSPVVDPLTGTVKFTVRAAEYPLGAVPGAFVRAELLIDRRVAAPSLPRSAIFELEGAPHVYVVEDGRAHRRRVDLGLVGELRAELRGGVEAGAKIVADAGAGITESMPVKVLQAAPAPDAAAPAVSKTSEAEAVPKASEAEAVPKTSSAEAVPKASKSGAAAKASKAGGGAP